MSCEHSNELGISVTDAYTIKTKLFDFLLQEAFCLYKENGFFLSKDPISENT